MSCTQAPAGATGTYPRAASATHVHHGRSSIDHAVIALFLLAVAVPALDGWLRTDAERASLREHRKPAPRPVPIDSLQALTAFPARYDAYFRDNFGARDLLLRWHNALKLLVLGASPTHPLVVGREGWVFFDEDHALATFRGTRPLDAAELAARQRVLESWRDWLAQQGCDFLYVLAPNKEQIYPEHMPARFDRVGPTRMEQLLEHLRAHSDVHTLDLRPILRAEKQFDGPDDHVYHPLGTHWTERGAWAASTVILSALRARFPAIEPAPRAAYELVRMESACDDSWGPVLYIEDWLPQPWYAFAPRVPGRARTLAEPGYPELTWNEVDDPRLPRVLLIHDSFGDWIKPFLAEHAAQLASTPQYDFPKDVVRARKPQVVIQLYTERTLDWPVPTLPSEAALLDSAAFARLPLVVSTWSAEQGGAGVEAFQETQLALVRARGEAALALEVGARGSKVLLPAADVPPGMRAVLHVALTAPGDSMFSAWYTTLAEPEYLRKNVFQTPVKAGRNELYLVLPVADLRGRLLVEPGELFGTYLLHAVEVRAARDV